MNEKQIAEQFRQGFDCSQVVLQQFAEAEGLDTETANRLSAAFGGGFMQGETCGAVVGALMAIGLKYGHDKADDFSQKEILSAKRTAFLDAFYARYPSVQCKALINYDFSRPEDVQKILDSGVLFDFCPKLVADVIAMTKEL